MRAKYKVGDVWARKLGGKTYGLFRIKSMGVGWMGGTLVTMRDPYWVKDYLFSRNGFGFSDLDKLIYRPRGKTHVKLRCVEGGK